jgi:hypothetical protein
MFKKLFSLIIIALMLLSVIGFVNAEQITQIKGIGIVMSDQSTGDKIDIIAYDNNNNVIETFSKKYHGNHAILTIPPTTDHLSIDLKVWKTDGWLRNGHWNHVFTNTLYGDDIIMTYIYKSRYDELVYNYIQSHGTVYASYANFHHNATKTCILPPVNYGHFWWNQFQDLF